MGRKFVVMVDVVELLGEGGRTRGVMKRRNVLVSEAEETIGAHPLDLTLHRIIKAAQVAAKEGAIDLLDYRPVRPPPPNRWLEGRWAVRRSR